MLKIEREAHLLFDETVCLESKTVDFEIKVNYNIFILIQDFLTK